MIEKLTSRKLWMAIAGVSTGIAMVLGVEGSDIATVAGAITTIMSVVTYIITEGKIDAFVAGIGTGGTLTGIGEFLLSKNPAIKIIAVEPDTSAVLSGKPAGAHPLQGIGAGFIPKVLNTEIISEVVPVSGENAGKTARDCAVREGILVGISSGAALFAALELSKRPEYAGKRIVVLLPDCGERYLSTWLFE